MSESIVAALNAHTNHVIPRELHRILLAILRIERAQKGSIDKLVADNVAQKTAIDALVVDLTAMRVRQVTIVSEMAALKSKLNLDVGVTDANYAFDNTAPVVLTAAATAKATAVATPTLELQE